MPITQKDIELYRAFQKSPILFVEKMWGLTPQPLKPEFKEVAQRSSLQEYKVFWFEPFIRGKHITWQEWIILLAIERALRGEALKRISVASGHGIGKDATLSWLILWYLFCFKDAQIPCTAPTSQQMYDILWKEISVWLGKMPQEIRDLYEWQTNHIRMKERAETWFARAQTARKENPEALAGVHGEYVFLVADEASGVHDVIFRTAEGALTDREVLFIIISNPTRTRGYFYDSHHNDKAHWQRFQFNSENSPIVTPGYPERIARRYGRDSDEYKIRVTGEFPSVDAMDEAGYVPLLSEADLKFVQDIGFVGSKRMGIDPSGEGSNKTSWAVRDSFKAKIAAKEDISNKKSIAQKTLTLMDFHKVKAGDVFIESFAEGADVAQEMAFAKLDDKKQIKVNTVNPGSPADDPERFLNKRAEMHWRLRDWARSGGEFVAREGLREQLLSIKYRREVSGKIKIMSKREMQKEGIPSPDDVDAIATSFAREDKSKRKPFKQEPYKDPFKDG